VKRHQAGIFWSRVLRLSDAYMEMPETLAGFSGSLALSDIADILELLIDIIQVFNKR